MSKLYGIAWIAYVKHCGARNVYIDESVNNAETDGRTVN